MSSPAEFPGDRGIPATTPSAAAIISALALPSIERFATDIPAVAALPDFASFTDRCNMAEEPRLTKVDVARSVMDDCQETLSALKKLEDTTAACKAAVIERLSSAAHLEASALGFDHWQRDGSAMVTRAEIATTLSISEGTAGALIDHSTTLVREQPAAWAMLEAGKLSWGHAVVIAAEANTLRSAGIDATSISDYERSLLARATGSTLQSFRDKARRLREKSHPESITARTKTAYACRRMELDRGRDGMSWLNLYLPAPTAEGIWDQSTVIARAAQGAAETRTLTQLRADVAASLLLCQNLADNRIQPRLPAHVTGPAHGVYFGGTDSASGAFEASIPEDEGRRGKSCGGEGGGDRSCGSEACSGGGGFPEGTGDPWRHETLPGTTLPGTDGAETLPEALAETEALAEKLAGTAGGEPATDPVLPPMPKVLPIVTIPMLSLLGLSNTPAELEGYGPISIDVAKRLMANAPSLYRAFTDPITGEALALNPDSRRVTKKMRAFLRSQDEFCAFPGCREKAVHADYDHITPWALGGKTTEDDLEPLCRGHHKTKHFKDDRTRTGQPRDDQSPERAAMKLRGWTPTMTESGRPGWTSPSGRYIPPEPRDVQAPSYPKWLKKWITRTLGAPAASANIHAGAIDLSPAEGLFAGWLGD